VVLEALVRDLAGCSEDRERDREVEARALLAQTRRCQVDRDPPQWELELGRGDPTPHALLRFLAGAIREAHDREGGHSALEVRLHLDPTSVEADERMRDRPSEQGTQARLAKCASLCR
jgi:hypothetical protein